MKEVVSYRKACLWLAILLCSITAAAQLEVGQNTKLQLNGNLGYNYTGAFGNSNLQSTHSSGIVADANLSGSYFHPNFLSFNVRPYFDRNQANSESQSIMRSSGISGDLNLFGGSRFPGTISYGRDFSSNSQFSIAGVPSILGDSSGENFGIAWSALIPNLPQVRVSYSIADSTASVTGLEGESKSDSKNFNLSSDYQLVGFNLHGNIANLRNHYTSPSFLTPTPITAGGSNTSYNVSAQRSLPLNGSLGLGWGHSNYSSDDGSDWSTSSYSAGVGFTPWQRFSIHQNVNYTTNLSAYLGESLLGGIAQPLRFGTDSDSLYLSTNATLRIVKGLSVTGYLNHRDQTLSSRDYSDSQYGGTVNYNFASRLLGFMYVGFGLVDTASKVGNQGLGIVANAGMNRRFGHWDTSADFTYSQNVQTLVAINTTSSYSYGGSIRRRVNPDTFWSAAFRGTRSGLVIHEGDGNRAESYSSSFSWRRYSFSGTYSQSSGTAVLTPSGALTAVPVGSLITADILYYDARSYSFNLSTLLRRRLTLTAGYANVYSSTLQKIAGVSNSGDRYNGRLEYRLRKFSVIGGFNRSMQDISTVSGPPRVVNSYYVSLTRWFNVF